MRITFILARADLSGGVRVVALYAEALRRRGHEVLVVSRPPRAPTLRERLRRAACGVAIPSDARQDPSHLDGVSVPHQVIDCHRPIRAGDLPDAEIVVATWWETAEWVAKLPPAKGTPVYFIQHYEAHDRIPAHRVDATWRLPFRKIVVARWLADLARDRFGDPTAVIVPNGVDLEQFSSPPRCRQPIPTVGLVYSPVAFKGCDIALKAVALARENMPALRLRAFGGMLPLPSLPLPLGTEFALRPAQDRIREVYAGCDAWLFSSHSEGFGLPLLEAMACRTPVIATPAGAAPDLLKDGGGVLVPYGNSAAMAAAIEQVCNLSETQWRIMSDNVWNIASRYSWKDAIDRFERTVQMAACEPRKGIVASQAA